MSVLASAIASKGNYMTDTINQALSKRLKSLTHETHDRLDKSIMAAATFDSVEGYARFAEVQYRFHYDLEALYSDAALQALLPDLIERRRISLIAADLTDLGVALPPIVEPPAFVSGAIDTATALGWLYVAEGSNMGAALLRKEAGKLGLSDGHGARHLAPAPEGPAAHWRSFTAALDAAKLTAEEEARTVAGANAAFLRVQTYADAALA